MRIERQINGTLEIHFSKGVMIFTPHLMKRMYERGLTKEDLKILFSSLNNINQENIKYAIKSKNGHFYVRKIYNIKRNRVEFEVISFCPNGWFDKYAVLVAIPEKN